MSDLRDIHLVFDTSAIVAYGEGMLDVGETLAEVDNEGGAVGLPLLCLATAASAAPMSILDVLVRNRAVEIFAEEPDDWKALGATLDLTGELPAASAALAAIDWECKILTRTPALYTHLQGGGPVIAF